MKIKNLKINGFGKLKNKEIEFSEGINVIKGKNESGKSTLLKFITSMLYGAQKTKNGKFISDYERYKPWSDAEYSGKMSYKLDNQEEYEIYREFKKKGPIIYNKDKDDISNQYQIDKNKESTFFTEQTGITEENFFSTSVSEQGNVQLSNTMKNEVIQKLSNIVTTGNENISYKKAIEKLNKNQLEKVGSQRSTGRPINIIEEEIDKIETEKKKLEEYKNKKYEVEEERQTIKINLEDTKTAIDLLRKQKVNLEKTKIELERVKIYKDMLIDDEHQKERITARIKELQEEREDNLKKNKIGYYISILAIIIITAISIIQKKYMILLANIVPIIVTILITIQNNKKSYKIKQEGKKIHQERIKLENELETIENEHNRKIKEIQQQENEILQNQKYQEEILKQEFNNKLDEQTIDNILSTTYEEIVEIIDEKERTQTQIQITAKTIEVDNENIVKELDNLVEMDEQLEKLYEKKDELLQLNNMYEMAKEEIEKSYQEMKENITPDFIEELKNIMIQVTNGKYANIYLDRENNLLIEIENGNYMPIEMLSIGTIDLIYLALRISAAREISKEKLPLILDESLAYYDDERLTRILKYLSQMKEYQILLFTCTGREEKILENNDIEYNKISL